MKKCFFKIIFYSLFEMSVVEFPYVCVDVPLARKEVVFCYCELICIDSYLKNNLYVSVLFKL